MKKLSITFMLSLLSIVAFTQEARIFGTLKNAKGQAVYLEYLNSPLDKKLQKWPIALNEQGQYYEVLPIRRPLDAYLVIGAERIPIYLEPKFNVEVSGKVKKMLKKAIIVDSTYCNLYIRDFEKQFPVAKMEKDRIAMITRGDFANYVSFTDSIAALQVQFLESYARSKALSKTFIRRQRATYRYGAANRKAEFVNDKNYYAKQVVTLSAEDLRFMNDLSVQEQDLISVPEFYTFLENFFIYHLNTSNIKVESEYDMVRIEFNLAAGLYIDRIKNIFLTKKFAELLQNYPFEISRAFYNKYSADVQVEEYRIYIEKIIEQVSKVSPGSLAPDITFIDNLGKSQSLKAYAGQVVFINFWASWCKPCMENIAAYNNVIGRYEGRPIVFINIAIEKEDKPWRKAFGKFPSSVVHGRSSNIEDAIPSAFQIKEIPAYVIIDKEGRIITTLGPKPGSDRLNQILDIALK